MYTVLGLFTCYNRREKTINCIDSLLSDKKIDWNFIVVDDNSTDGTKEALKSRQEVILVHGDGNLYYSGGMRLAIETAQKKMVEKQYDYVMMMNDDVNFYLGAVSRLIEYLSGEQAIMVGVTENENGEYTYGGIIKKSKWRPKYEHVISKNKKIKCDTFNGNCVLIPSDLFLKLDNIDAAYRHSFGDYDYGFSVSRKGVNIYASNFFVGMCEHEHLKKDTWEDPALSRKKRLQLKEQVLGHPGKVWFYFLKKNYGLGTAILYTVNDYMKILLRKN